ncbi:HK97-gp10 family putative phage morphogenesis protein [Magnetospirillum aberrantis]|uniref:HK97 gp10 family phage protein n=1 Tax=Magnetospirillum aberrantis SpK TaxID=908842 RepID=A0A7C9QTX9_9PROT|nr:HK97-gp10 family putative phage morphogenesis protein [Magnetospirillum aberrantis]NFV79999.1 hypothetical protein [Magnetospirillum aberrantis SpK]
MTRLTQSRVVGLRDARAILKKLPQNVQRRVLNNATRAGATVMKGAVRRKAPIGVEPSDLSEKYGPLKDNIRIVRLKRGVPKDQAEYRVDTGNAPQGFWAEFGTSRQPARPWFRPAADSAWSRAVARIKERLAAGVAREAEKLGKSQR